MEAKVKIDELKDRIMSSIGAWAESRIDEFAEGNPRMKVASVYMKRGIRNYLAREDKKIGGMIDGLSMFVCDEDGKVDTGTVFDDMMRIFKESDEVPFGTGIFHGTIGKGVIRIQLPDNPIASLLFGDTGAIKITDADILEFKKIIMENP